ncbi:MAG TPA: TlpA disulfide reductase family protein [Verrucomicrobiae bacterium]
MHSLRRALQTLVEPCLSGAFLLGAVALLVPSGAARAAEATPVAAELKAAVDAVRVKIVNGKKSEADLADQLKQFDTILANHKDEKTDDVAQVLLMKAMVYIQVLDQPDKGIALVQQLKSGFPDTKQGKDADKILENIKQQTEAKKVRSTLVEGASFPNFEEEDLEGKALSVSGYKGKVLLIDFWATWCGPCVRELPNVLKAYEARHKDGFEIIGISLDEDKGKLEKFLKEKNMPWQQYFDGKGWGNKLAVKFGVNSIPATYLLDREGKIIGKDLRGRALDEALTEALRKE